MLCVTNVSVGYLREWSLNTGGVQGITLTTLTLLIMSEIASNVTWCIRKPLSIHEVTTSLN